MQSIYNFIDLLSAYLCNQSMLRILAPKLRWAGLVGQIWGAVLKKHADATTSATYKQAASRRTSKRT